MDCEYKGELKAHKESIIRIDIFKYDDSEYIFTQSKDDLIIWDANSLRIQSTFTF